MGAQKSSAATFAFASCISLLFMGVFVGIASASPQIVGDEIKELKTCYDPYCRWRGDSPFCLSPSCPDGYKQMATASSDPLEKNDTSIPPAKFGARCVFGGTKTLCCPSDYTAPKEWTKKVLPAQDDCYATECEWHGNSPLCDGSCPEGTRKITSAARKPTWDPKIPNANFGSPCVSGEKVLCCPP